MTKKAAKKPAAKRSVLKPAPIRTAKGRGEFGEGNYKATRRFRKSEEAFVNANRSRIASMGKAAEDALEGPEGEALRAAETKAASHAAGGSNT